jgi:hypothetical protein
MGYTDLDRRRDGIISGANVTGSFDPNAIPYQYAGAYGTETRVQFPFESQWIQITAITSDTVKYAFANAGTSGNNYGAVGGNSTTHIMHIKASEIYVLNDAAITVGMSLIASGTNTYDIDTRY